MQTLKHRPDGDGGSFKTPCMFNDSLQKAMAVAIATKQPWTTGQIKGFGWSPVGPITAFLIISCTDNRVFASMTLTEPFGATTAVHTATDVIGHYETFVPEWRITYPVAQVCDSAYLSAKQELESVKQYRLFEIWDYHGKAGALLLPFGTAAETPPLPDKYPNWGFVHVHDEIPDAVKRDLCLLAYGMLDRNLKKNYRRSRIRREYTIRLTR